MVTHTIRLGSVYDIAKRLQASFMRLDQPEAASAVEAVRKFFVVLGQFDRGLDCKRAVTTSASSSTERYSGTR